MNRLGVRTIRSIVSAILACSLLSCQNKQQEDEFPLAPRTVALRIVHDPALRSYLETIKEQFSLAKPALSDGTPITLDYISELGVDAAKKISTGDIKADAWLAPSTSLINYANSRLKNLGARQSNCVQLFSTPVVIATDARNLNAFNAPAQEFSWNALSETKLALDNDGPLATRYAYSHGVPDASSTGFDALLQLSFFASADRGQSLSLDNLKSDASAKKLSQYEKFISSYSMDETTLLERTANSGSKKVRFTITTEQQVAVFNVNRSDATQPLVALYPEEGAIWQDYNFCLSDADWVTPAQRAALKIFTDFISSPASQLAAKKRGFRPAIVTSADTAPLTEQYGVKTSLPRSSFLPVSGDVVEYLLAQWPNLMRPSAVAMVLDASGSMEGAPISEAKDFYRKVLARSASRDLRALVSFNTQPTIDSRFTTDFPALSAKLDTIEALGGSAVYDGLRSGMEVIIGPEANAYRRTILMITDGDDKNSDTSLQMIQDMVSDKFTRYDIKLILIALTRPGADYADLKKIVRSANGIYREGSYDQLNTIFDEVIKNL